MKLDPDTTVAGMLAAMPSSAVVFERFGIPADLGEKTSLQQVCANCGVRLEEFLQAVDEIDWSSELTDPTAS